MEQIIFPNRPAEDVQNWVDVVNPSTGEKFAKVACHNAENIEQAMASGYSAFRDRTSWLPLHERIAILEKASEIIESRESELAKQIAQEGGKPLQDAKIEAKRAALGVKRCAEVIASHQGEVIPLGASAATANRKAFTQKEPIGLVLAISAFNHPLNLIVHQVATAVAAGCPVVVKPANDTPLSCISLVSIFHEAGLPEKWAQAVITPDISLAESMVKDARVAFFSFIGSAKVGWYLRTKLAPGARCALEHGGAAPVFVTKSADLDKAAKSICKGAYYHAGQVCISSQRIFVEKSVALVFSERLLECINELVTGDACDEATEVGPLIRSGEVDRVHSWVEEAKTEGAELLAGGAKLGNHYYLPTLLKNASPTSKVCTMEIFGPVAVILEYDDVNEAIEQANSLPVAFQASVFADSWSEASTIYNNVDASAVMLNDHSAFREDGMPFAGLRESGHGIGGIDHTIKDMQIDKMLVILD